ncbi:MAG: hypothetical protein O4861_23770, partial [Trichodesmium sp. St16_bin4-tuft]|nr:hypothetical protein [Trichodesmium sp. St16_bin4-tuft]
AIQILPIPLAGFLSTLLLNQNLWLKDDLISGTPRAFFYPLFLGFIHYFLKKSSLGITITITLLGLFYPQGVFLSAALLTLDFLHLPNQQKLTILTIGLTTAFLILLPYALNTSEYSPIITLTQAKKLPEFFPGGRASFFSNNNFDFWLTGDRSGLIPPEWLSQSFLPPQVWAGLLLFIFLSFNKKNITQKITNKIILLPELALASTGIFIAAHLLLFRLHHPSRYSQHSLRIIMALAGGIALTLTIELIRKKLHLLNHSSKNQPLQKIKAISISISIYIVLTLILIYPALTNNFPVTNYVVGKAPQLYEYLAQQPPDIRIASLALEANNIPTFAKRSILVSSEYALPYHQGYYNQIKQRAKDLIQAQYSPNLEEVKKIIHKYKIDFWLLDSQALTLEYVRKNHRLQQLNYTAANLVKSQMENGITPTLLNVPEKCRALDIHNLVLLEAKCILGVTSSN